MVPLSRIATYGLFLSALTAKISCLPQPRVELSKRIQATVESTVPMVFAHYMIAMQPPGLDYSNDIALAKDAGFDAFAINIGGDASTMPYFETYTAKLYEAAHQADFKVFLCIDTANPLPNADTIANLTNTYAALPAQLKDSNGNIVLTSFQVTPPYWNWQDVINNIHYPVNFLPGSLAQSGETLAIQDVGTGPFTWVHPTLSLVQEKLADATFASTRNANSKPWMAGICPWFFKRMFIAGSVDNWLHAQDSGMYIDRWYDLLKLKPNYIQVISWNDWGESHYIGPADPTPQAQLEDPSKAGYYGNLDHSGFLKITKYFIKAYKEGQTSITVSASDENIFMFHRIQPVASLPSASTQAPGGGTYPDNAWPLPANYTSIEDQIYVVAFLSEPATIYVNSGDHTNPLTAPAGMSKGSVAFSADGTNLGKQTLTASRKIAGATFEKSSNVPIVTWMSRYQGNVVAV